MPIFAVPTTAGTAAEVTINYVITDEEQRRKFVCVDPHDIPQVAFIDADMMDAMPPALKAATGVDAPDACYRRVPHSRRLGFDRCSAHQGHRDHRRRAARLGCRRRRRGEAMALGQYVAGMGFSNVGLGLVHGMAHPLGAFLQHAARRGECHPAAARDAL